MVGWGQYGKEKNMTAVKNRLTSIGGDEPMVIDKSTPYRVEVEIEGVADILFHRWNCDAVEAKAVAAKGSKEKKSDNIESYVYRDEKGFLALPGEYLRMSIIHAAKFQQDPRSPRKSAMDLYKAALVSLTPYASLGVKDWDYEDRRRVVVQRAGITRTRPAMKAGWKASFIFMVTLPEYVTPQLLNQTISTAGRIVGIADFRPTYGRFSVIKFAVLGG
jgi:hypothetical protein